MAAVAFVWWLRSPPSPEFSYPYGGRRVSDLRFSPDGGLIAACEYDDGLTLFEVAVGKRRGPARGSVPVTQCAVGTRWGPSSPAQFATALSVFCGTARPGKSKSSFAHPLPAGIESLKDRYSIGLAIDQNDSVYLATVEFGNVEKAPNYWGSPLLSQQALVWSGDNPDVQGPASIGLSDEFDVSTAIGRTRHFSRPGLLVAFRRNFQSPIRSR